MRKRIISQEAKEGAGAEQAWLKVEQLAQAEVSSEETERPLEAALVPGREGGWRAAEPGEQTIRLIFDEPQRLQRIRLVFEEAQRERTQEFVLRWSPDGGKTCHDVVRQQWNFSPAGTVQEVEDYRVELAGVTVLELNIVPDKNGGDARASLEEMRLA